MTGLESCLAGVNTSTNAAVDAFLKLDLATGRLFSTGSPLSYSEAEFVKLPREAMDKIGQQATADLAVLKQLVRAVNARRKEAAQSGHTELAARCKVQLTHLADRLEGPESLKISQLVGKAVRKAAAE